MSWGRRHLEYVLPGEFHAVLAPPPVDIHAALRVELARLGDVGHQLLDVARAHVLAHHYHRPEKEGVEWHCKLWYFLYSVGALFHKCCLIL